ncbi:acyl-CoA dehydrogenase family protein [Halobacterium litoreum]|uniref:Acyl-CoA dehydrogenase family protein n=1 Tax=Halobacterium litoreum TaxID=2039234 RepID=A0ABD5NCJ5_9EURY|nr:acyl-CoA dehydrogenase family protein [Halobacterium litoreum]UHH14100.1 acyl-CoA dehydrogenase family protein [Halobacterium litoreum]
MSRLSYGDLDRGRHCNYWTWDPTLRRHARRHRDDWAWVDDRLTEWGELVGEEIADNADLANRHAPERHTYDRRGDVQNRVEYHPAQRENDRLTYEFGVVADAFDAPENRDDAPGLAYSLLAQAVLAYTDIGFACPVSMTAGAALVLDNYGEDSVHADVLADYFDRLTAREHDDHVEGAMFLTEKQGGSDVGRNETTAVEAGDGTYRVSGEKWFCSNVDAEGTLVLARRAGAPEGVDGLSLFLVPHTKPDGSLNDQTYRRLKDKLGTRSVPTGEVELAGATGYLVGEPENGFRQMTTMLNFERVANAAGAVGVTGRALLEAKIHAANREAFGRALDEHPLMRRDLAEWTVRYEGMVAVTLAAAHALDAAESGDEDAYALMRALVPIAKYRTGRLSVDATSYAMEIRGGDGYVADYVTHRLLRDAQVLPIWEGPSNVLALDLLRALDRENAAEPLLARIDEHLDSADDDRLAETVETVREERDGLRDALFALAGADRERAQHEAKALADYAYDVFAASSLLALAADRLEAGDAREAVVAEAFVADAFGSDRPDPENALALEHFDAISRYAALDPAELGDAPTAD